MVDKTMMLRRYAVNAYIPIIIRTVRIQQMQIFVLDLRM